MLNNFKTSLLAYMATWIASAFLFTLISVIRPDLDVVAGANAMTAMFVICDLTAWAVTKSDEKNL